MSDEFIMSGFNPYNKGAYLNYVWPLVKNLGWYLGYKKLNEEYRRLHPLLPGTHFGRGGMLMSKQKKKLKRPFKKFRKYRKKKF